MIGWSLVLGAVALVVLPSRPSVLERVWRPVAVDDRSAPPPPDPMALAGSYDLLAACLRAGLPMSAAARAVSEVAPDRLAEVLRRAADQLVLGAEPTAAWAAAASDPATESLARMARRSARSGAPVAVAITELAATQRAAVEDAAAAKAERAGVLIGGPLGLCFLPAFICLGIVPVIVGLATKTLGNGVL